jgi:hypothetical protein
MAAQVKAGWYPHTDPEWLRWWDGKQWVDSYWPARVPSRAYLPDAPRFDISIPGEPRFDLVGENWREAEILAALGRTLEPRDHEFQDVGLADLVPEPDNPHDPNAISVRVHGHNVGYLPSEASVHYRSVVGRFITSGIVPQVRVRIWGVTRWVASRRRVELKSAIRLALPQPDDILPANSPPAERHYVIPKGRTVQVTGEDQHLDALVPWIRPGNTAVVATLHPIPGKAKGSTVLEVRIDGNRIGQLTPVSSASLLPMVRECEAAGRLTAVWATVSGSRLAADVKLRAISASEVSASWPSEGDVIPAIGVLDAPPPAYTPQVNIASPPPARGVATWMWVTAAIAALALVSVPYVGWLLGTVLIVGVAGWHLLRLRRAPTTQFTRPL